MVNLVGFDAASAKCLSTALTRLPDLRAIKEIRAFDSVLPEHQHAIYSEFEREYKRPWPGSSASNSYAALNWKGYVYVNTKHELFGGACGRADIDGVAALLAHEIWHIQSESNFCANEPWCLFEHEVLAAIVEESVRIRNNIISPERIRVVTRRVFNDYIRPLESRCDDDHFATNMYRLLTRRFVNNCKRRNLLTANKSIDVGRYENVIKAGSDHFNNKFELAPKGTEWSVLVELDLDDEEEEEETAVPTKLSMPDYYYDVFPPLPKYHLALPPVIKTAWDLIPDQELALQLLSAAEGQELSVMRAESELSPISLTQTLFQLTDPSQNLAQFNDDVKTRQLFENVSKMTASDLITTLLDACVDRDLIHPNDRPPVPSKGRRSKRKSNFHYWFIEGLALIGPSSIHLSLISDDELIRLLSSRHWRYLLCEWANIRAEIGLNYLGFVWDNVKLDDPRFNVDLRTLTKTLMSSDDLQLYTDAMITKVRQLQSDKKQRSTLNFSPKLLRWITLQEYLTDLLSLGPLLQISANEGDINSFETVVPAKSIVWHVNGKTQDWTDVDLWSDNENKNLLAKLLSSENRVKEIRRKEKQKQLKKKQEAAKVGVQSKKDDDEGGYESTALHVRVVKTLDEMNEVSPETVAILSDEFPDFNDDPTDTAGVYATVEHLSLFAPGALDPNVMNAETPNQPYNMMLVLEVLGLAWYPCRAHTAESCTQYVVNLRDDSDIESMFIKTLCAYWQFYHNPCARALRQKQSKLGKYNCAPMATGDINWSWGARDEQGLYCSGNNQPIDLDTFVEFNIKEIVTANKNQYPDACNSDLSCPFLAKQMSTNDHDGGDDDGDNEEDSSDTESEQSSDSDNYKPTDSEESDDDEEEGSDDEGSDEESDDDEEEGSGDEEEGSDDEGSDEESDDDEHNASVKPHSVSSLKNLCKANRSSVGVWSNVRILHPRIPHAYEMREITGMLRGLGIPHEVSEHSIPKKGILFTGMYAKRSGVKPQKVEMPAWSILKSDAQMLHKHSLLPYFDFEPEYVPYQKEPAEIDDCTEWGCIL